MTRYMDSGTSLYATKNTAPGVILLQEKFYKFERSEENLLWLKQYGSLFVIALHAIRQMWEN